MSRSKEIEQKQISIAKLRSELVLVKDTNKWYEIANEINSLSVDIAMANKSRWYARNYSYIPDRIVITQ